jgi:DNA-directed RNA polymerase subunit RPC12/RpoP
MKKMNKYICLECGTKYQSEWKEVPPGIKWSDGHVCDPISIQKAEELEKHLKVDWSKIEKG